MAKRTDIKSILIIGAGPIGLGAALFAKLAGAKSVILMDRDAERVQVFNLEGRCYGEVQSLPGEAQ